MDHPLARVSGRPPEAQQLPISLVGAAALVVRTAETHPLSRFHDYDVAAAIDQLSIALERHRDTDRAHWRMKKRRLRPVKRHELAKLLRAFLEQAS